METQCYNNDKHCNDDKDTNAMKTVLKTKQQHNCTSRTAAMHTMPNAIQGKRKQRQNQEQ